MCVCVRCKRKQTAVRPAVISNDQSASERSIEAVCTQIAFWIFLQISQFRSPFCQVKFEVLPRTSVSLRVFVSSQGTRVRFYNWDIRRGQLKRKTANDEFASWIIPQTETYWTYWAENSWKFQLRLRTRAMINQKVQSDKCWLIQCQQADILSDSLGILVASFECTLVQLI